MRGAEDVSHGEKRVVRRYGLFPVHVDGGACDLLVLQSFHEIFLVNDSRTCGVDQIGGRFHFGEPVFVDHSLCGGKDRKVDADHIALGKHGVQIHSLCAVGFDTFCRHIRIIGKDLHSESLGSYCDFTADSAVACDTQLLAVQLETDAIVHERMLFIQRSEGHVLDIRNIVDIFLGSAGVLAFGKSGCGQSQITGYSDHQTDVEFSDGHTVSSRCVGQLQSGCIDRIVIHRCRCSLGNAEELHSGVCPGLDRISAGIFIAEHDDLVSHALFTGHILCYISLAVLQFAADRDITLFTDEFHFLFRDRRTKS